MKELDFTGKLDYLVPHHLTEDQREWQIRTCVSLLSLDKNEPLFTRIVIKKEKWVIYHNVKLQRIVIFLYRRTYTLHRRRNRNSSQEGFVECVVN